MPPQTHSPGRALARSRAPGLVAGAAVLLGFGAPARALQPGMGGGMGGMPAGPGAPQGGKDKKDGPAEAAPKDKKALQPIEPVPARPRRFRRLQLFELHGYMRVRGDYFHRPDLGMTYSLPGPAETAVYVPGGTQNKFIPPPSKFAETDADGNVSVNDANCTALLAEGGINPNKISTRCNRRNGFPSANMRLRLEPTIHVSDTVKVHAQIDALDNVVLGSTPDSYFVSPGVSASPYAPINLYSRTQVPPQAGINGFTDSILVKRAYGEIRFGWGLMVEFGRMPHHWGLGVVANDGNGIHRGQRDDIIRQVDMDWGDSVDSLRFSFDFGKDRRSAHRLTVGWDWAASGPTSEQLLGPQYSSGNLTGQSFSIEKFDNVHQWRLSIERRDERSMLERKLSLGRPVFNYGLATWLRYQSLDTAVGGATQTGSFLTLQEYTDLLVPRQAFLVTPDLWMRVMWKTLRVELELAGVFGTLRMRDLSLNIEDNPPRDTTLDALERQTLVQVGYALEFKYGFFKDRFHIGLDQGMATGDDAGPTNLNPQNPLVDIAPDSARVTNFRFNPAYTQDLLLFREQLGTVSNAVYFRPWAAFYFFQNNFSARLDLQYAFAPRPAATWGGGAHYGIEIDGAVRYHDTREPIFFQIQYGVLFPFNAFDRPTGDGGGEERYPPLEVETEGGMGTATVLNNGDAKAAQTVQAQLGIKF